MVGIDISYTLQRSGVYQQFQTMRNMVKPSSSFQNKTTYRKARTISKS